ncbi:hypothetical protein RHSIM_Rhsim01G0272400 [Rhododendron simsii]|uniref:Isopenicillin N synthase-like Fe(2+) 2OG dioxygenase domain-containing protein n=1 Tax=Rhododendron simsii TaxID=118357 RepID=A0A834HK87_RHOSS|nr:hypothetical protein RHSIM_Rhsim01G0272400 [Rhododendron simsii]
MEEEEVRILEPYELRFSDLMILTSDKAPPPTLPSSDEIQRLESISRSVMETLGPTGPGLLTITGVPNASRLRRTLLPLARRLALLNASDRKRLLKEHGLGSDVPVKNLDRSVSSFAMQLKYMQGVDRTSSKATDEGKDSQNKEQHCPPMEDLGDSQDIEFKDLGSSFKELGFLMMELGLCLARICDKAIGGQELEQSLLESCMAKSRLIHYHSSLDNLILKEAEERQQSTRRKSNKQSIRNGRPNTTGSEARISGNNSNMWQQWHYDYGIFTVLTSPWFNFPCHKQTIRANGCFCTSCEIEYPSPSGHTYLEIFDPNKNIVQMVKTSPESFILQVGESADILSRGKLRANLHSVRRPAKLEDLSRETFVVFLQPAWSKTFSLSNYPIKSFEKTCVDENDHGELGQELHKIVPPISSRIKDGMTFAEFSRETTKQYYGVSGDEP